MADVSEIGPEMYRISVYVPELDMQFNHFLLNDEEPLLFHGAPTRRPRHAPEC